MLFKYEKLIISLDSLDSLLSKNKDKKDTFS